MFPPDKFVIPNTFYAFIGSISKFIAFGKSDKKNSLVFKLTYPKVLPFNFMSMLDFGAVKFYIELRLFSTDGFLSVLHAIEEALLVLLSVTEFMVKN